MKGSQLYYTLNKNIQTADLKKNEKEEIIRTIKEMNQEHKEAMFLIIYEHYKNDKIPDNPYDIPYGGTENLEFNLGKFPISLRRILFKFIKLVQKNENYF